MRFIKLWRSLPLKNRTGSEVFATLFYKNDSGIATLLESPYPNKSDRPQTTGNISDVKFGFLV
ncbi:hypothetical protein [Tolypothrix sp. VBCCA 56010]|uniref:hypothetical protein n=1 Tax=Tolypothrix sp. VBCCA 56010 TaxID=3137731 RepID=UPI003D7F04C5